MPTPHWGNWVKGRMFFLGFRRQKSLADSLRCTQDQPCKWLSMENPPAAMRKGFDAALCAQLRSDAFTVFTNFRDVVPEAAPVLGALRKPAREPIAA